jgi:hypothetical protein
MGQGRMGQGRMGQGRMGHGRVHDRVLDRDQQVARVRRQAWWRHIACEPTQLDHARSSSGTRCLNRAGQLHEQRHAAVGLMTQRGREKLPAEREPHSRFDRKRQVDAQLRIGLGIGIGRLGRPHGFSSGACARGRSTR